MYHISFQAICATMQHMHFVDFWYLEVFWIIIKLGNPENILCGSDKYLTRKWLLVIRYFERKIMIFIFCCCQKYFKYSIKKLTEPVIYDLAYKIILDYLYSFQYFWNRQSISIIRCLELTRLNGLKNSLTKWKSNFVQRQNLNPHYIYRITG